MHRFRYLLEALWLGLLGLLGLRVWDFVAGKSSQLSSVLPEASVILRHQHPEENARERSPGDLSSLWAWALDGFGDLRI